MYRARNEQGELFAVKILKPDQITTERRKRFKNELTFGVQANHQNVVRVLDQGVIDLKGVKAPFYVMPLYGESLRAAIERRIPPSQVLPQFAQILNGVEAAHLRNIIHRDLKPENILHDGRTSEWLIADFGIADFTAAELYTHVETKPTTRLANFSYAAPEQKIRGARTDQRTDIFALGLILNEMFTGAVPVGTRYRTIASVAPELEYLDGLVDSMIRSEAANRPDSIDAIKRELQARRNGFVERQRLSTLKQAVVPTSELDDPIANDPVRVIAADWEDGMLTLTLNHHVNPEWVQILKFGHYGKSSLLGKGPEVFAFSGNTARIQAGEHQAQPIIDYFKSWLAPTHDVYVAAKKKQIKEKEERERRELEHQIRTAEARERMRGSLKI